MKICKFLYLLAYFDNDIKDLWGCDQSSKWKFEFTGLNQSCIYFYIVLNKNWKIYWSEQSFTGLGPENRCSSWGLCDCWIYTYLIIIQYLPGILICAHYKLQLNVIFSLSQSVTTHGMLHAFFFFWTPVSSNKKKLFL